MSQTNSSPRHYQVVRKVIESDVITSFFLQPTDGKPVMPFRPGQFLTLDLDVSAGNRLRRTYSLSCSPDVEDLYRITVKREPAPPGMVVVPAGVGSGFLHDHVDLGSTLTIHNPKGDFVLNTQSTRPVVLLSGGVGLTPLVSMLHALVAENRRDVWFIHACESGDVHALGNEVRELAARSCRVTTHFCYMTPAEGDVTGYDFDSEGPISKEIFQQILPLDDYDVYMCGPGAFMQAMFDLLTDLGVQEDRIAYEFFGTGTALKRSIQQVTSETVVNTSVRPVIVERQPDDESAEDRTTRTVRFAGSEITVVWNDDFTSLLEFAEAHGLTPDFSCRAGVCNTCECGVSAGELKYVDEPLNPPPPGRALLCCSIPASDITLDL